MWHSRSTAELVCPPRGWRRTGRLSGYRDVPRPRARPRLQDWEFGINRSGVGEGTGREDTTNLLRQQVASLCDEANRLPARHMALHTGQHSSPGISRVPPPSHPCKTPLLAVDSGWYSRQARRHWRPAVHPCALSPPFRRHPSSPPRGPCMQVSGGWASCALQKNKGPGHKKSG